MSHNLIYLIALFILLTGFSCSELENKPITKDGGAPGPVTNVEVETIPGGAYLTYQLPDDTDLLYVKGQYELKNGQIAEQRASLYHDTLKIVGFGDTNEKKVTVVAVDRSENESSPVEVTFTPQEPSVHTTFASVKMIPDFGGVQYTWINENNASLAFILLARDSTGLLFPFETVYSAVDTGKYTLRGFDPTEREFGVVIRDRWDNYSDTMLVTLTPLFEEELDKDLFQKIELEGDADMDAWEGRYEYAYDDNPNTFNHTWAGSGWPQIWTLDLGVTAKISRLNVLQRQNFFYAHGNPRNLEVWGRESEPTDGSFDGWTKLCDCEATRPTLQGGTPDEDQVHFEEGDNYGFDLNDPPVRYIRFVTKRTWGNTGFIHFAEVSLWGQIL
ncbi:DUF4959 domain-containing protein [Membranicola marinus]|uniref:DUF4959 domain-containing protein n=1 Tax=Membranihabitans marinus TaxID=1227546 RepID=A0A953HQT9_9BACT|nr:DUF4959 domain-containing protein [Membranihabitans marinus]MBY5959569.1 DUF4959 domain-containing protein [Membranihabitans marinus]